MRSSYGIADSQVHIVVIVKARMDSNPKRLFFGSVVVHGNYSLAAGTCLQFLLHTQSTDVDRIFVVVPCGSIIVL
jgi:hypothetical protein